MNYIQDDTTEKFIPYFNPIPDGADSEMDPAFADYKVKAAIIMTYYAFTTLSTVGLGDFHPRSNAERVLCAIILLVGSTMFSYIMGNFIDILYSLKNINVDFKDELMLTKFMGSLTRFNGGQTIDHKRQERIERYFDFRWTNDRNIAVSTSEDEELIA